MAHSRRHAAEQLYLQLLSMEPSQLLGPVITSVGARSEVAMIPASSSSSSSSSSSVLGPEDFERCLELLLGTSWDGDLEEARAARDALSALVRVPVPLTKVAGAGPAGGAVAASGGRRMWQSGMRMRPMAHYCRTSQEEECDARYLL